MIPLQAFQQILQKYAKKITGIQWYWQDEPQASYVVYPLGYLNGPTNIRSTGTDQLTWVEEDNGDMTPVVDGERIGTFTFQVVSRSQDPKHKAHLALEKLRAGFSLPDTVEAFNMIGFSCLNPSTTPMLSVAAPFSSKDRVDSIVSCSIPFGMCLDSLTGDVGSGGRLEKIEVASTMLGLGPFTVDSTIPL